MFDGVMLGILGFCALCFVGLIVSLVNLKGQKKQDFERRHNLIGLVNQMCGPGQYAFSADYNRLLFVNQAGDMLVYARWKGARHEIIPIHPHELMGVRWEEDPVQRLTHGQSSPIRIPRTAVFIDRANGPVLGLVFGHEQTAADWTNIANSIAARYNAGYGTMRVN